MRILSYLVCSALALTSLVSQSAEVALEGNCAVCLLKAGKLMPGADQHSVVFDRQVYLFPSERERREFATFPSQFAPVLGGDCVVCRVEMGARVPGRTEFSVIHNQRLFLFPSAKERDMFEANPQRYERGDIALDSHCSVCVIMARKWVAGSPNIVSVYDGMRYLFPSQKEKRMFDADPARYAPALDGNCAVCLKDGGKRVAGQPRYSAMHEGRLFLFPDADARQKFLSNPAVYASLDLAQGGECVVCAKVAGKRVPGQAQFASIYKGLRYLFPSAKERSMFDAAPADFLVGSNKAGDNAKAGPAAANEIRVVGSTACAGCAFGVRPLKDSGSLGIAVVSNDIVYVVEGGEAKFPQLFDERFDEVRVELVGAVKKRQGKFVWIEPVSLTKTR